MATQFNKQQPRLKELRATKPEQSRFSDTMRVG